jgi:hypothetical protein
MIAVIPRRHALRRFESYRTRGQYTAFAWFQHGLLYQWVDQIHFKRPFLLGENQKNKLTNTKKHITHDTQTHKAKNPGLLSSSPGLVSLQVSEALEPRLAFAKPSASRWVLLDALRNS